MKNIAAATLAAMMLAGCGDGALTMTMALTMCQLTLKKASLDPDNASIPFVKDFGSGDEYYFAWGRDTQVARMRNGLGLDVAVTASCIVDKKSKSIKSLTLNGQSLI